MLVLTFSIDHARYGLDVNDAVRVMPMPPLRRLEGTPEYVAGVLPMLGRLLPVIDLCALHVGRPCRRAYATRIIVVRCPAPDGGWRDLAVAAEQVTDLVEVDAAKLQDTGVKQPDAPWLGPMAPDESGALLQVVAPDRLITEQVWELLTGNA
jgi:chemotaxis-related protein WspB